MKSLIILVAAVAFFQITLCAAEFISDKELVMSRKAQLNDTKWKITITPISGEGKARKDVIIFEGGKVLSKQLKKEGFTATNFSVRVKTDDTLTWETIQVSEENDYAFWRGDIKDGIMTGVLSKKEASGTTIDYSFLSKK